MSSEGTLESSCWCSPSLLQLPSRCGAQGDLGTWLGLTGAAESIPGVCEPSWVGPGVMAAHREDVASTADHLVGLGNFNIFLGLREITRALPCRVQLGGDLRVELHAL